MDIYDIFNVYAVGAADALLILKACGGLFRRNAVKIKKLTLCLLASVLTVRLCFGISASLEAVLFTALYSANGYLPDFFVTVIVTVFTLTAAYFALKPIKKISLSEISPKDGGAFLLLFLVLIYAVSVELTERLYGGTVSTDCLPPVRIHIRALSVQLLCLGALLSAAKLYIRLAAERAVGDLNRQYAEKAAELYRKTVSFRHDIKNHLTVIDCLLKKSRRDKAAEYTEKLCGKSGELSFTCFTGVTAVDALLESKFSSAKQLGIQTECTLKLPKELDIDDIDLCTIFGNAADNALNACQRLGGGYISLSGTRHGDLFFIRIENSSAGESFSEGIGMKSIRAAAEKYGGEVIAEMDGGVFCLTVVFDISRR